MNSLSIKRVSQLAMLTTSVALLSACGGGGSSSSGGAGGGSGSSSEMLLIDPTPGANDYFGAQVVILNNGNIVVSDPGDSSVANENGAVHLYNPTTRALISSVYGDHADDQLGLHGITALENSNYVICTKVDSSDTISNAGSARLINGTTGVEIQALQGDQDNDFLCSDGITALSNSNYIISSGSDDNGAVSNAGSVRLMNGITGDQISVVEGSNSSERFGSGGGVTLLGNGNFVVANVSDASVNSGAGSVRLIDGSTGNQISILSGDNSFDLVGSQVAALGNNNYVVTATGDDTGFLVDVGSVRLMNGDNGNQIGVVFGDDNNDAIGDFITVLSNNNYVVSSRNDNNGLTTDASSVRLFDGTTSNQISALFGDESDDALGQDTSGIASNTISALNNGNYVIRSPFDNNGLIDNAGSVRLMDGATGAQLGSNFMGDIEDDRVGESSLTVLDNNNYVVASSRADNGAFVDAGSVQLFDGGNGNSLGLILVGSENRSRIASDGVASLGNNNYVVASGEDDDGTKDDAGSIRLFNGSNGVQINALFGDNSSSLLGLGSSSITVLNVLGNNDFVVLSPFNGNGSVRLVDGDNGNHLGAVFGESSDDLGSLAISSSGTTSTSISANITAASDSSYFLIGAPSWNNGDSNTGLVHMVTVN